MNKRFKNPLWLAGWLLMLAGVILHTWYAWGVGLIVLLVVEARSAESSGYIKGARRTTIIWGGAALIILIAFFSWRMMTVGYLFES